MPPSSDTYRFSSAISCSVSRLGFVQQHVRLEPLLVAHDQVLGVPVFPPRIGLEPQDLDPLVYHAHVLRLLVVFRGQLVVE